MYFSTLMIFLRSSKTHLCDRMKFLSRLKRDDKMFLYNLAKFKKTILCFEFLTVLSIYSLYNSVSTVQIQIIQYIGPINNSKNILKYFIHILTLISFNYEAFETKSCKTKEYKEE